MDNQNIKETILKIVKIVLKILGYTLVEVLSSQALILLLKNKISDPLAYGLAIVVIMGLSKSIKEVLGSDHPISQVL